MLPVFRAKLPVDDFSCESKTPNVNNYHPQVFLHALSTRLNQPHYARKESCNIIDSLEKVVELVQSNKQGKEKEVQERMGQKKGKN